MDRRGGYQTKDATHSSTFAGTVFAYGVTSSGKTHTMHVSDLSFQ